MKRIIIFTILIVLLYFVNIPPYVELNDLIIINKINVICSDGMYKLDFSEILPIRNENGITYKYKSYSSNYFDEIDKSYDDIFENIQKKVFFVKNLKINSNCKNTNILLAFFKNKKINTNNVSIND